MTNETPTVLLTRPQDQSARFAETLGADIKVVISPVIRIVRLPVNFELADYDGLIITSANSLPPLNGLAGLPEKPAFVVGRKTAKTASALGLNVIASAPDVTGLLSGILDQMPGGRWLYVRGKNVRMDIEDALKSAGIDTESAVIYRQDAEPLNTDSIELLQRQGDVVLPVFSHRSAEILSAQISEMDIRASVCPIFISETAKDGWRGAMPKNAVIASAPDAASMREEIMRRMRRGS